MQPGRLLQHGGAEFLLAVPADQQMPVSLGIGRHEHPDRPLVVGRPAAPLGILDFHHQLADLIDVVMADLVAQKVLHDFLFGLDRAVNCWRQPSDTQKPGRSLLDAVLAGTRSRDNERHQVQVHRVQIISPIGEQA